VLDQSWLSTARLHQYCNYVVGLHLLWLGTGSIVKHLQCCGGLHEHCIRPQNSLLMCCRSHMDACILAGKGERSNSKKLVEQDQDQALESPWYVEAFTEVHRQGSVVSTAKAVDAFFVYYQLAELVLNLASMNSASLELYIYVIQMVK